MWVCMKREGGSKRLFLIWFFLLPLEHISVFVFLLEYFDFWLIRWSGFNWNLPWHHFFVNHTTVCPTDEHWTKGTDALVSCFFFLVSIIPLFLGLLISSLRVLMVRLRVQSMQADMPVGSGGSTCSPFHNVHSFHTVATALHYKDTLKHTQTRPRRCTPRVEVFLLI